MFYRVKVYFYRKSLEPWTVLQKKICPIGSQQIPTRFYGNSIENFWQGVKGDWSEFGKNISREKKLEWWSYQCMSEIKFEDIFTRFDGINECEERTANEPSHDGSSCDKK